MKYLQIFLMIGLLLLPFIVSADSFPADPGGNWTRVTADPGFSARYDYGSAVFNNSLWVIGGRGATEGIWQCEKGTDCGLIDVWKSSDGITWEQVTANPSFGPRGGPGMAVFNNQLFVIGGSGKNDVWVSPDGITWKCLAANAGFSPRSDMGVAVFDGRLFVIAGGEYPNLTDDVWSSPDGITWTREAEHAGFGPRYGKGVTVFRDHLWMIGGTPDGSYVDPATGYTHLWEGGSKDIWISADGKNWTLMTADAPFKYQEFTPVATFSDKLWIIGGGNWRTIAKQPRNTQPHAFNEVWSSSDGINWSLEPGDSGFAPRFLHGILIMNDRVFVLGGTDNGIMSTDVWSMPLPGSARNGEIPLPENVNASSMQPVVPATTVQSGINPISCCLLLLTGAAGGYCLRRRSP